MKTWRKRQLLKINGFLHFILCLKNQACFDLSKFNFVHLTFLFAQETSLLGNYVTNAVKSISETLQHSNIYFINIFQSISKLSNNSTFEIFSLNSQKYVHHRTFKFNITKVFISILCVPSQVKQWHNRRPALNHLLRSQSPPPPKIYPQCPSSSLATTYPSPQSLHRPVIDEPFLQNHACVPTLLRLINSNNKHPIPPPPPPPPTAHTYHPSSHSSNNFLSYFYTWLFSIIIFLCCAPRAIPATEIDFASGADVGDPRNGTYLRRHRPPTYNPLRILCASSVYSVVTSSGKHHPHHPLFLALPALLPVQSPLHNQMYSTTFVVIHDQSPAIVRNAFETFDYGAVPSCNTTYARKAVKQWPHESATELAAQVIDIWTGIVSTCWGRVMTRFDD